MVVEVVVERAAVVSMTRSRKDSMEAREEEEREVADADAVDAFNSENTRSTAGAWGEDDGVEDGLEEDGLEEEEERMSVLLPRTRRGTGARREPR